jgi:hypothetical protein
MEESSLLGENRIGFNEKKRTRISLQCKKCQNFCIVKYEGEIYEEIVCKHRLKTYVTTSPWGKCEKFKESQNEPN